VTSPDFVQTSIAGKSIRMVRDFRNGRRWIPASRGCWRQAQPWLGARSSNLGAWSLTRSVWPFPRASIRERRRSSSGAGATTFPRPGCMPRVSRAEHVYAQPVVGGHLCGLRSISVPGDVGFGA
jgi:hypothetical protein